MTVLQNKNPGGFHCEFCLVSNKVKIKVLAISFCGGSKGESVSRIIQIVGGIQFHVAMVLSSYFFAGSQLGIILIF